MVPVCSNCPNLVVPHLLPVAVIALLFFCLFFLLSADLGEADGAMSLGLVEGSSSLGVFLHLVLLKFVRFSI